MAKTAISSTIDDVAAQRGHSIRVRNSPVTVYHTISQTRSDHLSCARFNFNWLAGTLGLPRKVWFPGWKPVPSHLQSDMSRCILLISIFHQCCFGIETMCHSRLSAASLVPCLLARMSLPTKALGQITSHRHVHVRFVFEWFRIDVNMRSFSAAKFCLVHKLSHESFKLPNAMSSNYITPRNSCCLAGSTFSITHWKTFL